MQGVGASRSGGAKQAEENRCDVEPEQDKSVGRRDRGILGARGEDDADAEGGVEDGEEGCSGRIEQDVQKESQEAQRRCPGGGAGRIARSEFCGGGVRRGESVAGGGRRSGGGGGVWRV